jgi:hypothetical protein
LAKFFWPLARFGMPMGYDTGIYRYLFLKHAEGFPPFVLGRMQPWAYEHPLGLFIITSPFVKMGLPVDWLIGWIWNLMPVVLAGVVAWAWRRRSGTDVGILTLLCVLLSQAYFDGFASMYWKTFLSLIFYVVAVDALERRSWLAVLWGIFAVVTHHQTGLIFGLALAIWAAVRIVTGGERRAKEAFFAVGAGVIVLVIGAALYWPIWHQTVAQYLPKLLSSQTSGSFPPPLYYLQYTGILLAAGAYGFCVSWKREKGSMWQISVLLCFSFIALQLLFFRRFFLQFDFFLLPFAAVGIVDLWKRFPAKGMHLLLIVLLTVQAGLSVFAASTRSPGIDAQTFASVRTLSRIVPEGAMVISLDNQSAPYLLGWLPNVFVGGPGLFSYPDWSYAQWEDFFFKGPGKRRALIQTLPRPLYVYAPPYFRSFYGAVASDILADPCFEPTADPYLLSVRCAPASPAL